MFTTKHYKAIAQILGSRLRTENAIDPDNIQRIVGISLVARDFIEALAADNPRFDATKFSEAIEKAKY